MISHRIFSRFDGDIFTKLAQATEGVAKRRYTLLAESECQDGHGGMRLNVRVAAEDGCAQLDQRRA